jgi:hypothetical protein
MPDLEQYIDPVIPEIKNLRRNNGTQRCKCTQA